MEVIKFKLTFTEQVLGTCSANPEVYRDYIASKAPDAATTEEEVAAIGADAVADKGMTVFPRTSYGTPFLYDYQIKGFFKDAAQMLKKIPGTHCSTVKAFKKEIDGLLFPQPRQINLHLPAGGSIGHCQRPLRASTAMGERIALSDSESMPAGTWCEFQIVCMTKSMELLVKECMDYGALRGIGCWRNSGMGRFTYEIVK